MWDLVVVGAGPAGATAALAALSARPGARVLMLDRASFPRDKACGDGVAPHVLDVLATVGVTGLLDDRIPVSRLELSRGPWTASGTMRRPAWVVPRRVLDARLVEAAVSAGAELRRHRVRDVVVAADRVIVDGHVQARAVVGADGATSVVRRAAGLAPPRSQALALRGYAPTPTSRSGRQVIRFGDGGSAGYAWSFDRGDGWSNIGYGEVLRRRRQHLTRRRLVEELEALLPGATTGARGWVGHHLPLSTARWQHPDGRILLAGDAAALINPLSGEGLYYAVASGAAAGRAAVTGNSAHAGAAYRLAVRRLLRTHLLSTATVARAIGVPGVLTAGLRAADSDHRVFDDLVELGLGRGLLTPRVVAGLALHGRGRRHLVS
ncbi:NAD(P)/FAD-dependent oxidoreductase [Cellulomonas aerilata]|uniref:Menaquinone reductase n=1 Tax=Cellulomonas aerilata TaxID=515326 RepID=A0A512DAK5_9CELL|nr:geranylgeranyl reductase family protein [Cellulomonas aerilata]GEO33516.1 menaquinone reductase [Cellulomonas aerilata]